MARGMISAPQPEAVEAGALCLRRGGNAIDAAVTCALVETVVEMASMDERHLTFSIQEVKGSEVQGSENGRWGVKGEPTLATLTITAPGLSVGSDLKRILGGQEKQSRGPLTEEKSFAVETTRVLLFLYKGRIIIESGEEGDRLTVLFPVASPEN